MNGLYELEEFNELINSLKEQCKSYTFQEALFKKSAIKKILNGIDGLEYEIEELKKKAEHPSNIEYLTDYITDFDVERSGDSEYLKIKIRLPKGFKFGISLMGCLKKPYQKPKIKLSQFEYDSLSCCNEVKRKKKFSYFTMLKQMKYKGYYKGVYDMTMSIQEILDNCEVVNEKI